MPTATQLTDRLYRLLDLWDEGHNVEDTVLLIQDLTDAHPELRDEARWAGVPGIKES